MDSSRFMKVYANLPLGIRNEVVVVLDEDNIGPLTWNAAYVEIANETELGRKILAKLIEMGLV